jgi:hypothetical protein
VDPSAEDNYAIKWASNAQSINFHNSIPSFCLSYAPNCLDLFMISKGSNSCQLLSQESEIHLSKYGQDHSFFSSSKIEKLLLLFIQKGSEIDIMPLFRLMLAVISAPNQCVPKPMSLNISYLGKMANTTNMAMITFFSHNRD